MITDQQMQEHLGRFLAGHGARTEDLLGEVEKGFGTPELIVASGSVLHGFGNAASDIDLHIVVPDKRVTSFPVSSHRLGVTVDTTYAESGWVRDESAVVVAGAGSTLGATRAQWKAARTRMRRLSRLGWGYALQGTGEWTGWQREVRAPLVECAVNWWHAESLRYHTASRLLARSRPLAAAVRSCDAATAALDAVATSAGEVYLGHKWLGLKLERLGRADLEQAYARLVDMPVEPAETPAYQAYAAELIERLVPAELRPDDPYVVVTPTDGTTSWQVHDRVLVHRYGLRGVELAAADAGADPKLRWAGRLSELPEDLVALIEEDLVWMSVAVDRP